MNRNASRDPQDENPFRDPLIRELGELTAELTGVRLTLVHPTPSGWTQTALDQRADLAADFCKLFQRAPEGARHCRMCHILMAVAACGGAPAVQRCHAGACVMVSPAADASSEALAVLGSCVFADPDAWAETSARGKALGVDLKALRKAFRTLPKLDDERRRRLQSLMKTMSLSVRLLKRNRECEERLRKDSRPQNAALLDEFLRDTDWARAADRASAGTERKRPPWLIRVIGELVRQRPDLPLTVKDLAAAARMTPNHLSFLVSRWTGRSFSDYLAEQRIERAKRLLENPTLNINEIARQVGFDDPGYFARRFRQIVGRSPREWRDGKQSRKRARVRKSR